MRMRRDDRADRPERAVDFLLPEMPAIMAGIDRWWTKATQIDAVLKDTRR